MRARRPSAVLVLAALSLVAARPARAQSAPAVDLDALYADAKTDLKAQRYAPALEKFKRALDSNGADAGMRWALLVGAALSYQGLKQPVAALEYLQRFAAESDPREITLSAEWKQRRVQIDGVTTQLEQQVLRERGALSVSSEPPGARLAVDGAPLGVDGEARTPFVAYLEPGSHRLVLELDGHEPVVRTVAIEAGNRQLMPVALQRRQPPAASIANEQIAVAKETPKPAPVPASAGADLLVVGGHIAFWSGLAIAAFGGVATYLAYASDQAYRAGQWDQESTRTIWNVAAIGGLGVGGAALATGAVLWLWPSAGDPDRHRDPIAGEVRR